MAEGGTSRIETGIDDRLSSYQERALKRIDLAGILNSSRLDIDGFASDETELAWYSSLAEFQIRYRNGPLQTKQRAKQTTIITSDDCRSRG